jgi:hypothetical protein
MSTIEGLGRKASATAKFKNDFESKTGNFGTQEDSITHKPLVQEAVNLIFERYYRFLDLSLCSYAVIHCLQPNGKSSLDVGPAIRGIAFTI